MARPGGLGRGLGALDPPGRGGEPRRRAAACTRSRWRRSGRTRTSRGDSSTRRRSGPWPTRSARSGCSSRSSCGRPVTATSSSRGSGAGGPPAGSDCRPSRRWCARPTTTPRSSRPWSRTCSARSSTRSRRPPRTSSSSRTSASRTSRSRRVSVGAGRRSATPSGCSSCRPSIQRGVRERQLSMGHARALLGTPDRTFQESLAKRIVKEELSVRAVEDEVRAHHDGDAAVGSEPERAPGASVGRKLRPAGFVELEELLGEHLDTRVKITVGGAGQGQDHGRVRWPRGPRAALSPRDRGSRQGSCYSN